MSLFGAKSGRRVPIGYGDEVLFEESVSRGLMRCSTGVGRSLFVDQLQLGAIDPSQTVSAIHECPFVIYPQQQYDAQEQLKKHLAQQGHDKTALLELRRKEPPSMAAVVLFDQAEQEEAENARIVTQMRGRELRYGDVVQIQHVWSNEWVSVVREPAELDRQALSIALTARTAHRSILLSVSLLDVTDVGGCRQTQGAIRGSACCRAGG